MIHIEVLTPKQNSVKIEEDLDRFEIKYNRVIEAGFSVSIPDNPMGRLSFKALEVIEELNLSIIPDRLVVHTSTFHTKDDLDQNLKAYLDRGVRLLLVVSGDGGERLHRLSPEEIGEKAQAVTSVELIRYLRREYKDAFSYGVAFNPYEPEDHELNKMKSKIDAGAEFIMTQPIIGNDEKLMKLKQFSIPVIAGVWMSRNLDLLSQCTGNKIFKDHAYDPAENLKALKNYCTDCGFYLSMVNFATQFDLIKETFAPPTSPASPPERDPVQR